MKILKNEPLKKHTTFRIGGNADHYCQPKNVQELLQALAFAKQNRIPVFIMGNGSNLLALDNGFRGLVVQAADSKKGIIFDGHLARVWAGTSLPKFIKAISKKGFSGLEFLAGIPGTVGGAVVMNAGAWGKEIGALIKEVSVICEDGTIRSLNKKELHFNYRKSSLQKMRCIVVEATFKLNKGKLSEINDRIRNYLEKRREGQPLGMPNAGSIFRNPPKQSAGKLIEEAGCKGMRSGDAQISQKHANFIVNLGEAKASDVLKLMTKAQKAVNDRFKIRLEPEIKIMVKSLHAF
ncbi:MAG: UDP-N-acetylmuramate dehydrogenase [Candidatus Margulisiibacteriota bacterium]